MALFAFIPGLPFVPFLIGRRLPRRCCLGGAADQAARGGGGRGAARGADAVEEVAGRSPRHRRDPHGVRAEPGAGGDGRGDRARRAHPQYAQPYRHRVRADPAGDPADRQSGPAAGQLRDPGAGGRGGAERDRDRQGAGALARRGGGGAAGAVGGGAGLRRAGALDRAGAAGGGGADGALGRDADRSGGDASSGDRQGELRAALHPALACASSSTSSPR